MVALRSVTKYVVARHHHRAGQSIRHVMADQALLRASARRTFPPVHSIPGLVTYARLRPCGEISTRIVSEPYGSDKPGAVATLQCDLSYKAFMLPSL